MAEIILDRKAPVRSQALLRSECRISGHRVEVRVVRILFSLGILE